MFGRKKGAEGSVLQENKLLSIILIVCNMVNLDIEGIIVT